MVSTVTSRETHYEMLGLSPTATQDEITRAFSKKMSLFGAHSMAVAAQVSLAFEVLRDPAKRRAYDRTLGLIEPAAAPMPNHWALSAAAPSGAGLVGSAWSRLAEVAAPDVPARPAAPAEPQRRPEASAEAALPALLASSLREPPKPRAQSKSAAAPPRRIEQESVPASEDRPIDWKRPVLALGGLVVAAGLIGTMAGVSVKDSEDAAHSQPALTVAVPTANPTANATPAAPAQPATSAEIAPERPIQTAAFAPRTHRPVAPPAVSPSADSFANAAVEQSQSIANGAPDSQPAEVATDQPATETPAAAQSVAAAMPLSNATVARTIERIGYSCGNVASTAAVDGAEGAFKVTCSSGQSYQATRLHGRYHFRRLGSR
jgi:hypothetical protein